MNILIFGGTGYIGRKVTEEFLLDGNRVFTVSRKPAGTINRENCEFIQWDYTSPFSLAGKPVHFDAVINLAGETIGKRWTSRVKKKITSSRFTATSFIVSAINNGTLITNVLINASGTGYYGPRGDKEITESEQAGNDFLANVCSEWEKEANKVIPPATRIVTIRTGVVLGKEGALKRMALPFRFFVGGPLSNQWLSWIHERDLSRMIRFIAVNNNITGPVNAVAPKPVNMHEFSRIIGKALKRPSWFPVPGILLKIILGRMSEMLLHGQRAVPKKMLDSNFEYLFPNVQSALENIFETKK